MQLKRITSPSNNTVKEAARLARKRHRYERRIFLAEGEDLLDAALERGVVPRQVFVLDEDEALPAELTGRLEESAAARPGRSRLDYEVFLCGRTVMERLSQLGSGSRVICVFGMFDLKFPGSLKKGDRPFLYLAGTGDPGNVGTLLRAAAAMGVDAVVMGPGTADPYSPKALRATMGSVFQIPFCLTVNPDALVSWAAREQLNIICADAHTGGPVWKAPLEGAFILVLGSEREGVPHRLTDAAAESVRIPQEEQTESINVAMAGTAILYEALRQRSPGRG